MPILLKRIVIACMALSVLAVLIAGVYVLMNRDNGTQTNTNSTLNTNTTGTTNVNAVANANTDNGNSNTNATTSNVNTSNSTTTDQESILRLARIFVERYGTFSNRNNFENITSLEPFMTTRFQQESAEYISQRQSNGIPDEYYGITTTVASLQLEEFVEDEAATVRVATRRVETKSTQDPTVFTQYIQVQFKNVEGSWKVDSATWE